MPNRVVNFFAVFNIHLLKDYCSDIKFFPQSSISTTITRCPANVINLSAIIVVLRLHSFIHSGDLDSASSRDYYSEALPATDKKEGLERDVKFGRVGHQHGTQLKGEIIPC